MNFGPVSRMIALALVGGMAGVGAGQTAAPAAATPVAPAPSTQVMPAVGNLRQAMAQLHVDRWKGSKQVKDTAAANLSSLGRDFDGTLPGLLAVADASPNSVAALLPVSRNLGAVYDVLLRVTVSAEMVAPANEFQQLEQARMGLDAGRRSFDERVQSAAVADGQRVIALQKQLAVQAQPVVCPVVPAAPAPAKAKKKKPVAKPVAPPS